MAESAAEERRNRLREAAIRVIAKEGIPRASTRSIAREAELNQATVHYAFDSKEELLLSIPSFIQADVGGILETAVAGATTLEETIDAASEAYWAALLEAPDVQRVQYEVVLYSRSREGGPDIGLRVYDGYFAQIRQALERTNHGRLTPEEIDELGQAGVTFMDGVIIQYLQTGDERRGRRMVDVLKETMCARVRALEASRATD